MKNNFSFILVLLVLAVSVVLVPGCNSKWCISADGKYGEYSGGVQYCFNQTASESSGKVMFSTNSGEKATAISFSELSDIKDDLLQSVTLSQAIEKAVKDVKDVKVVKDVKDPGKASTASVAPKAAIPAPVKVKKVYKIDAYLELLKP